MILITRSKNQSRLLNIGATTFKMALNEIVTLLKQDENKNINSIGTNEMISFSRGNQNNINVRTKEKLGRITPMKSDHAATKRRNEIIKV